MADEDQPSDQTPEEQEPPAAPPAEESPRDWLLTPEAPPAAPEPVEPIPEPAPPEPHPEPLPPEPIRPPEPPVPLPPPPVSPSPPPPPLRAAPPPQPPPAPRRRRLGLVWRMLGWILILVLVVPPAVVGIYRFAPPPVTPLMLIRLGQGRGMDYRFTPLSQISPSLVQAAVAAEDARFCEHHGFDFQAIKKAMAHNERRPGRIRGGSTISQQTAKNVFLWPGRSYLRKGLEAWFTVLIEALWGKRRIMEVYLNVVEMGPGLYGADAAARRYFQTDAAHLSNLEASRLAAIFPNPLKWKAVDPGRYVQKRSRRIGGAIGTVRVSGLSACVGRLSGVAPEAPPELGAAPPPAAQPFVRQQAAQQEAEAPPASSAEPSVGVVAPSTEPALDAAPPPESDAQQSPAEPPSAEQNHP